MSKILTALGVGVVVFITAMSASDSERESMFIHFSQKAAWASDRFFDAQEKGSSKEKLDQLKKEWDDLEAERFRWE